METRLVDDLDGSTADETVTFALDGMQYEIDLTEKNAAKLRKAFEGFVASARRSGSAARRRPSGPAAARPVRDRERTAAIREWARANGHEISDRGRIPSTVIAAYEEAS